MLFLLPACKNRAGTANIKEIIDPVLRPLAGEMVIRGEDDLMVSNDITLTDSTLTIIKFDAKDRFLMSYSLDDWRLLYSSGSRGRGPKEFRYYLSNLKTRLKTAFGSMI